MSIIAKSLKKIKNQGESKEKLSFYKSITFVKSKYFTGGFYGIITAFIFLSILFGANYYFFVKKHQSITDFNVSYYENKFNTTLAQLKKNESENKNEIRLKYYLTMNNFDNLQELLDKIKLSNEKIYLKYYGILLFKKGKYDKAIEKLSLFLDKYHYDRDVISYLGNIFFFQNNFHQAIALYSRITNDNFETAYNRAIIFEHIGDLKASLKFYKKAYSLVQDPLLKKRIYNKIFLMENYESEKN